jgi:hypothetical protein
MMDAFRTFTRAHCHRLPEMAEKIGMLSQATLVLAAVALVSGVIGIAQAEAASFVVDSSLDTPM